MVRNRGKKALYEVMSKARDKPGYGRTLEQMQPKSSVEGKSAVNIEKSKATTRWMRKPRIVQFNFGRIEFSMPYQLAVALVLGLILLVLAAFRLGQEYNLTDQRAISTAVERPQINRRTPIERETADIRVPPAPVEDSTLLDEDVTPVQPRSTGNNVIVLVQYEARADLVPVRAHFAEYGIDTEIVMENGRYFLQTKNRYDNPGTPGTDGYKALQEIIKVGAKYKGKAPPSFETFAPNFFSDAYGKKVK
ncbi:MAG: hypothetical protein ACETWQ_05895 [Phycisphaerae bacterium]